MPEIHKAGVAFESMEYKQSLQLYNTAYNYFASNLFSMPRESLYIIAKYTSQQYH
jgi:hypothetical protein